MHLHFNFIIAIRDEIQYTTPITRRQGRLESNL